MTVDLMDYEALVRDAYRLIVRKVLIRVAKTGLPGDHHFYVTFDINAPGVEVPDYLHARFPDEMTVVLQHDFWGLEVDDAGFEVQLHFDGKPTRLAIPFDALTGFLDPSVQFGVKFQGDDEIEFSVGDFAGHAGQSSNAAPDFTIGSDSETEAAQPDSAESDDEDTTNKTGEVIALSNYRKD